MGYDTLFKNGSWQFIKEFVAKLLYDGMKVKKTDASKNAVYIISLLIAIFILYKLCWLVWKVLKFIISCLEW